MAGAISFVAVNLNNNLDQQQERGYQVRLYYRNLRDASNPFEINDKLFLKHFRLNKIAAQYLIDMITPNLEPEHRTTSIPNVLRIFCPLHFYGNSFMGMSQPSVSRCITQVSDVINRILLNFWIKFPTEEESITQNKNRFFVNFGFPDVLGAIDCSHVAIIAPPFAHPIYLSPPYYNRKGFYSINVQIVVNSRLQIIQMIARYPGYVHDSAIWMMSNLNRHLKNKNKYINDTLNDRLIGDQGFSLSPWLMIPYPGHHPVNSPEGRFNLHLRRARTIIERLNGVLKSRFRCMPQHRTLHYNSVKAAKIIYACGVLHNIAIHFNVDLPNIAENVEGDIFFDRNGGANNNYFLQGGRKRDAIRPYFNI